MTRAWRRLVLAVGYAALAAGAFVGVVLVRPSWLCAIIGHDPKAWRWTNETGLEETECRVCEQFIYRQT